MLWNVTTILNIIKCLYQNEFVFCILPLYYYIILHYIRKINKLAITNKSPEVCGKCWFALCSSGTPLDWVSFTYCKTEPFITVWNISSTTPTDISFSDSSHVAAERINRGWQKMFTVEGKSTVSVHKPHCLFPTACKVQYVLSQYTLNIETHTLSTCQHPVPIQNTASSYRRCCSRIGFLGFLCGESLAGSSPVT